MDERAAGIKKRWRAWLRAIHRDVGYLAVGFTVIYAVSGIAMNHLDDWDPNFVASERQITIAPVPDDATDAQALAHVTAAAGVARLGEASDVYRAGDEVRIEYASGARVTAIGETVTIQERSSRFFFRVANWLHATRGKPAWKFISDAYGVLLLYLAISGIFMIKGRLGLRWRGAALISAGVAGPIAYIVLSGGPDAHKGDPRVAASQDSAMPVRQEPPSPPAAREVPDDDAPAAPDDDVPQGPPVLKPPPPAP